MQYIYAALLLHKMGKPVTEEALKKVIAAAGTESDVDDGKVKALVASLKGVDIDKELENAVIASAAPATAEASEKKPEKKEEKKEEAAEGLSALFG